MLATSAITIWIPTPLRAYCGGRRELQLSAANVHDALAALERDHPALHGNICDETGALRRHLSLFVNTTHIRDRNGLDTTLLPGDVVAIMTAVSGG